MGRERLCQTDFKNSYKHNVEVNIFSGYHKYGFKEQGIHHEGQLL